MLRENSIPHSQHSGLVAALLKLWTSAARLITTVEYAKDHGNSQCCPRAPMPKEGPPLALPWPQLAAATNDHLVSGWRS